MSLVKRMTEIDTLELYKTDTLRKNVSLTEQGKNGWQMLVVVQHFSIIICILKE